MSATDVASLPRFACPDWWEKIQAGETPMADIPLNEAKAKRALAVFDRLRLPDVRGNPTMAESCGQWFIDLMLAFLASEDPQTHQRIVWELLCMVPKKNSKSTYVAGLALTALQGIHAAFGQERDLRIAFDHGPHAVQKNGLAPVTRVLLGLHERRERAEQPCASD